MTGRDDQPAQDDAAQGSSPDTNRDTNRELHRRTRTRALGVSATTLAATWVAYCWTQAHRQGLQFQTTDVARALVSVTLMFAAGAVLGGAGRPVRRRYPRLAAYATLVAPLVVLGMAAVHDATDTQIGGAAPGVDVLGIACAILVVAMIGVRLTRAGSAGVQRSGRLRRPWPAWLAGLAVAIPVLLVGGTAGLVVHQATIVNDYDLDPLAHEELSAPPVGRRSLTPAQDALERRYPEVAAVVDGSGADLAAIAARLSARAGSEDGPGGWTEMFNFWAGHQRCLAAESRVWLPVLHGEMTRNCDAFGRFAASDPAETVYGDVLDYVNQRCLQLSGHARVQPTFWLLEALPPDSPVADPIARIDGRVARTVTAEGCDAEARG